MKITAVNSYTNHTNALKQTDNKKNEKKYVSFGFGEDYGGDPFPMPKCDGDGDGASFGRVIKDALLVFFAPITLPIITYRIHLKDKKEDEMYRRMLDFKVDDDGNAIKPEDRDEDKRNVG